MQLASLRGRAKYLSGRSRKPLPTRSVTSEVCSHANAVPVVRDVTDAVSGETFEAARCRACALVVTRPLPASLDTYYSDQYHAHQAVRDSLCERTRQRIIARYVYAPISRRAPGRLLDVGCGAGRLASTFATLGWDVHGVEPSEHARKLASRRGITIHGQFLEDATGRFDAIIFNHVLEHIPAPQEALRNARAMLTPGGMVGIAVPNFGSWQRRLFGRSWLQLDMPRHVNHFERGTLLRMVQDAGLEPVRIVRTPFLPTLTSSLGISLTPRAQRLLNYALFPPQLLAPGDCLNIVAATAA